VPALRRVQVGLVAEGTIPAAASVSTSFPASTSPDTALAAVGFCRLEQPYSAGDRDDWMTGKVRRDGCPPPSKRARASTFRPVGIDQGKQLLCRTHGLVRNDRNALQEILSQLSKSPSVRTAFSSRYTQHDAFEVQAQIEQTGCPTVPVIEQQRDQGSLPMRPLPSRYGCIASKLNVQQSRSGPRTWILRMKVFLHGTSKSPSKCGGGGT